ncbi:TonB-dependent receptor [Sphingomonas sp.]|uniref:TonB-dependent receptor n=1 Tax=Sphingomonas sp. TaxID=28214 RepID=UPI0025F6D058|nr:TonB-dependent receptor [Sphingomonas sp.]MBV9529364.1 TonB-dependent receptor [Sphingomonas sp.]
MQAVSLDQPAPAAIIVTGHALPEAKADRAYAVERLTRQQIEQSPTHELDQLLKDVPGVQLFRRSDAHSGHPTSQGVTLRALGGNASSRALLVLDGVPQTDPFGGWVNWPAYDPLDLGQIRVVRGGGSVANGPGALAGTIEMTSRDDGGTSGELDAGSRDSLEGRGRLALDAGSGLIALSARVERGDGFIPVTATTRGPADKRAPYRNWDLRGRWSTPLSPAVNLQASLDGFHDWRTRGVDYTENRTNGADASLRLVGEGAWRWSALGYWQARDLMSSFASVSPGRVTASRVSLQDDVPARGMGASIELRPPMPRGIELRFGSDARRTDGESRELYSYIDGDPTRRRKAGGDTMTVGGFVEATADVGPLTLTGGARVDHWEVSHGHLREWLLATGEVTRDDHDPTRQGWLPTARGGALIALGGGFNLRSAAYLGWRMPTLNELFRPFRAGADATAANPDLDPERLAGAEAGAEFVHGAIRLSATGFVNRLKDAIANVTLGQGPGIFPGVGFVNGAYSERQNIGAVDVRGLEASASWTSGPWSLLAGVSLTHARVRDHGAAARLDGLRPAQTPRFAATLSGGWQQDGRSFDVTVRRLGAQFDDDLNTHLLRAATTLDASAAWPLSRRVQFIVRGENLTDMLVEAGINADESIERATPRTLWLGVRLR